MIYTNQYGNEETISIEEILTPELLGKLWDAGYWGDGDDEEVQESRQASWINEMIAMGNEAIDMAAPNHLSESACDAALTAAEK